MNTLFVYTNAYPTEISFQVDIMGQMERNPFVKFYEKKGCFVSGKDICGNDFLAVRFSRDLMHSLQGLRFDRIITCGYYKINKDYTVQEVDEILDFIRSRKIQK